MLASKLSMGKLRGQWHNWRGIKLMPIYHPAFLLRSYTDENRAATNNDLRLICKETGANKSDDVFANFNQVVESV
jgi:DNA polymerase